MKNALNNNVDVNNANRDRTRLGLDHDINTTMSIGAVQPMGFMDMLPHDKVSFGINSLVRASAMVVPAWAKLKMKLWSFNVPINSVFPNYEYFLTGKAVNTSQGKFIPTNLPYITSAQLAALCVPGAKVSVWSNGWGESEELKKIWRKYTPESVDTSAYQAIRAFYGTLSSQFNDDAVYLPAIGGRGRAMNINWLFSTPTGFVNTANCPALMVPMATSVQDVFEANEEVSPSNCDFCIISSKFGSGMTRDHSYAICFSLSDFGKNMLKLFTGLKFRVDFSLYDTKKDAVSLLPLFAWARGSYNLFAKQREKGWQETALHYIIHRITEFNEVDFTYSKLGNSAWWSRQNSLFWDFIFKEVSSLFYPTEQYDFVSSHRVDVTLRDNDSSSGEEPDLLDYRPQSIQNAWRLANAAINGVYSAREQSPSDAVVLGAGIAGGDPTQDLGPIPISLDQSVTMLDMEGIARGIKSAGTAVTANIVEMLKRLNRMTSKYDVGGANVRTLLKMLGYDAYVDHEPVEYVGYREFDLNISEVTATSDTFNGDVGRVLGEQAGKSVTRSNDDFQRPFVVDTKTRCYFFVLGGIMPESGYVNMADAHHYLVSRDSQYEKEFEGLGYDCTRMERLFQTGAVSYQNRSKQEHAFGFIPRFAGLKFVSNVNNGDFARSSKFDALLPYTCDKIVRLSDINGNVTEQRDILNDEFLFYQSDMDPNYYGFDKLPVAGEVWSYAYRVGYLGLLNRMFVNFDENSPYAKDKFGREWRVLDWLKTFNPWTYELQDNFLVHNRASMSIETEMLPVGATYQTQDDSAKANETVSLA